ncbi:putative secreted protein (Por secretion system target) [Ulvibacter sp. MAR_2010_11]|uniref:T9SS type A sorting domain-containing protein n=1 Tax=Ulvibacter sp. MAR_2010_11 TaxID=1250229 RepID=UPI000C2BA3F6|nr:T9SS type A sorting domain-containing protein [Ulvibacter sp. MAR_2010_11]PKA83611.1 putative secreted protein (Por secretion system target) [Ulvibacter sp. MAR_2010_11]
MKLKLLLVANLLCIGVTIAQFGPQQIISSTTGRAYIALPFDIDNDGIPDVLKTGIDEPRLYWHKNLDGEGNFGPEILISNATAYFYSIDFVDLDSDGDKDLIYLRNNPRNVAWLENLDGVGNFAPEQIILETIGNHIQGVTPTDIDNDGDLDLLATISDTFSVWLVWHENVDGNTTYGEAQILIENFFITSIALPNMVDIDNDGLLDMLTAYELGNGPGKLVWYRNLGDGMFDSDQEIHQFLVPASDWISVGGIQYIDINTDGKKDIAVSTHHDDFGNFYFWFENIDNLGSFGDRQDLYINGRFVDIDNDGDNDILVGEYDSDRIYWVENMDSLGTFGNERTITTEIDHLRSISIADFNGDGLIDVVSASISDDKIAWYENTGILGLSENTQNIFVVYPNPTKEEITLLPFDQIATIELSNDLGQRMEVHFENNTIDLSSLASGLYLLKITGTAGDSETHKIVKQ